jgi:cell division transport system permease protein
VRNRINYYFKEAIDSFTRNWVMSFAAIMVVLISVLLVGFVLIMGHIVGKVTTSLEDRVEIEVYLSDAAPAATVNSFGNKIKNFPEVQTVKHISKDEAMKIFKQRYKNNPSLIEEINGNPLPASYKITLKDPHKVGVVANKIKALPEKDQVVKQNSDIKYAQQLVQRLFVITYYLRWIMIILVIFMAMASLALISNTVRMAIYARRKEIAVMRLVGASNWFIRFPFILEGIIQGLAGAVLAIVIIHLVKSILFSKVQASISFFPLGISTAFYQLLLFWLLLAGMAIGAIGSTIALRRYLRV